RRLEHDEQCVAAGPELDAVVSCHRVPDQQAMDFQQRPIRVAELVQEAGRAFDVGEQERERPCRERAFDQPAGSQNSSWMLSGSRNTMTDPIGVSAIGEWSTPRAFSSPSHASSSARLPTLNAK